MDLQQIIDTWRGPLVGLIAGWGASWRDATELAQDTFVAGYLARERFEGNQSDPAAMGPWLRGIARNLHRAHQRHQRNRREEELTRDLPGTEPIVEDPRLQTLRESIARLPLKHREVVCVYYLEDCSLAEAAGILGISTSTLEGRLYQARKAVRRMFGPGGSAMQQPKTTPQTKPTNPNHPPSGGEPC